MFAFLMPIYKTCVEVCGLSCVMRFDSTRKPFDKIIRQSALPWEGKLIGNSFTLVCSSISSMENGHRFFQFLPWKTAMDYFCVLTDRPGRIPRPTGNQGPRRKVDRGICHLLKMNVLNFQSDSTCEFCSFECVCVFDAKLRDPFVVLASL
jgi:hypothetical protein